MNEGTLKTQAPANSLESGKLNRFQRTMLDWNDVHPYNAVHVVRVPAALDVQRLRSAVEHTLENRGLTELSLDRNAGTYHYRGGHVPCEIQVLEAQSEEQTALTMEIERQLNTPFILSERFSPFRFFAAPATNSFSLGLTYFHAVADAESSVVLVKEIFQAYLSRNNGATPGTVYPPCFDNLLRHHPAVVARKLSAIPAMVSAMRTSSRPPYRNGQPTTSGFMMCALGPDEFQRLTTTAKSWGVTMNDLFLGLLMKSLSGVASDRTLAGRRRKISVGSIVNTRRDLGLQGKPVFGLFLGSFLVAHEVPDQVALRELALDLHCQTETIKRRKLYLGATLEMAVARFAQSLFSVERRQKFYHRYYPLWGGITNLNLNQLWQRSPAETPIDYLRAVSTSPAIPLVLSVTTSGSTINIGFTFRSTAFLPAEMEQVKNCFLKEVAKTGMAA